MSELLIQIIHLLRDDTVMFTLVLFGLILLILVAERWYSSRKIRTLEKQATVQLTAYTDLHKQFLADKTTHTEQLTTFKLELAKIESKQIRQAEEILTRDRAFKRLTETTNARHKELTDFYQQSIDREVTINTGHKATIAELEAKLKIEEAKLITALSNHRKALDGQSLIHKKEVAELRAEKEVLLEEKNELESIILRLEGVIGELKDAVKASSDESRLAFSDLSDRVQLLENKNKKELE